MNNKKRLLLILLITFFVEAIVLFGYPTLAQDKAIKSHNIEYKKIQYKYAKKMDDLKSEMEIKKYQATGNSNYERIYNMQDQSIIKLIKNITTEAVPETWETDVKTEEFFNFILIIQIPALSSEINLNKIDEYLIPIVQWTEPYLQNIAIFNKYHQCVYYFDSKLINQIKKYKKVSSQVSEKAKEMGSSFTLYNSTAISFSRYEGHIFLPIIIYGHNGSLDLEIMLDTGATTTMIAKDIAEKTLNIGDADQKNMEVRQFSTANGIMRCPIFKRNIVLGGFDTNIEVAVSMEESTNLLGMNYFSDKDYLIDSNTEKIYLWKK